MELSPLIGHDVKLVGRQRQRLNQTIEFVNDHVDRRHQRVLSIGQPSTFDHQLYLDAGYFTRLFHTEGDLDSEWTGQQADVVFCFEVIEHLCNPLLFLRNLKRYVRDGTVIFVTIPNHLLRRHWRNMHYHEVDYKRFSYLCAMAGYEIVHHEVRRLWPRLSDITGIRPFIRFITGYSWFISRTDRHFYLLKLKIE